MENTLFLQSEAADPYPIYERMREQNPVYRDTENGIWAVYSHVHCTRILQAGAAHVPGQNPANAPLLNESAAALAGKLARLANPPTHPAYRQAVLHLFERMRTVDTAALLSRLLIAKKAEVDWVGDVCKKLPALAVLESFGFADEDVEYLLSIVEHLTKLMLPNKSAQQIADVNMVSKEAYVRIERHLLSTVGLRAHDQGDEMRAIYVANLIGLLIQSYDAGRGILSNALLQALAYRERSNADALVIETLRFDPPIHNTRRVMMDDMELGGQLLRRGDAVLLVLAAANRDPTIFANPNRFDPTRINNRDHLTFGAGIHQCAARHFSVRLAAETLAALFAEWKQVDLLQTTLSYEPMINARLPQQLIISLR